MADYFFNVFEVESSYYTSPMIGNVLGSDLLTISDGDTLLHSSAVADTGGDQLFSFAGQSSVTNYSVDYLDFANINGGSTDYELFAMVVQFSSGPDRYYVMSKDPGFNPNIGDTLAVTSFSTFTNTTYSDVGAMVCFAEKTRIATPSGPRPIEALRPGDLVQTVDNGPRPILWAERRELGPSDLTANPHHRPIELRAAGERLVVSPQHRIAVEIGGQEQLLAAKHLLDVPGVSARRMDGKRRVRYHHLLLGTHELLVANGVLAESLYIGSMTAKAIGRHGQAEIRAFFPDLFSKAMIRSGRFAHGPPARPCLSQHSLRRAMSGLTGRRCRILTAGMAGAAAYSALRPETTSMSGASSAFMPTT